MTYLFSGALHDFNRDCVDFVVHLHRPPLSAADFHEQHSEVCPPKIQS